MTVEKETPTSGSNHVVGVNTSDHVAIIDDDDLERQQLLAHVSAQAALQGYEFRQTATGFVLRRGAQSWHFSDLKTGKLLLKR